MCPWCLAFGGHELSKAWCVTSGDDVCVQFSQHPTNGSTVGFFGVFDGKERLRPYNTLPCITANALFHCCATDALASLDMLSSSTHLHSTMSAVQAMAGRALRHMCRRTCGRHCRATTSSMQTSSRPWVRSLACGNSRSTSRRCSAAEMAPLHVAGWAELDCVGVVTLH